MDRIVEWLQNHAPDAKVRQIILADDTILENPVRKPRVYESVGIEFEGRLSKPIFVRDLKRQHPERILEKVDLYSVIEGIQAENRSLNISAANNLGYIRELEAKLAGRFWRLFRRR